MEETGLFLFGTSRRVDGFVEGPFHTTAVPPRLGDLQARFQDRWVLVTGRFGDPTARTCRATGEKGLTPNRSQAIRICRSIFVVSAVSLLTTPSTSTASPGPQADRMRLRTWLAVSAALGGLVILWFGRRRRA